MSYALRILCEAQLPDQTIRITDGSRTVIDGDGNRYRPSQFVGDSLQAIEAAINGTSQTLTIGLTGLPTTVGDSVWEYDEATPVSGSKFLIKILTVDDQSQPLGDPEVVFTGMIDNLSVADQGVEDEEEGDGVQSLVTMEIVNRFALRTLTNGAVLSDVDQKARSAILNPMAALDRFCGRVTHYLSKRLKWPSW